MRWVCVRGRRREERGKVRGGPIDFRNPFENFAQKVGSQSSCMIAAHATTAGSNWSLLARHHTSPRLPLRMVACNCTDNAVGVVKAPIQKSGCAGLTRHLDRFALLSKYSSNDHCPTLLNCNGQLRLYPIIRIHASSRSSCRRACD